MGYEQERERYRSAVADLDRVVDGAMALSHSAEGLQVRPHLSLGGTIFAKLTLHAHAVRTLAPRRMLTPEMTGPEIWDLSSLAVLTRAVVDSYYAFFYLAADEVTEEEQEFRILLWDYHCESERLDALNLIRSRSGRLPELARTVKELKDRVTSHGIYKKQDTSIRKKLRSGSTGIPLTYTALARRANISPNYHKAVYKSLSNYVHAFAFSVYQMHEFKAGNEKALHLLKLNLDYCCAFVSMAIRDFSRLFPDHAKTLDSEILEIVDTWQRIVENFGSSNLPQPS